MDLASQPRDTAVCVIEWRDDGGTVLPREEQRLTDEVLRDLMSDTRIKRVGIDAPFGWPSEFVDAVASFRRTGEWTQSDPKHLEFRRTDLHVKDVVRKEPLSVTTDWLVWAAWRCARLLDGVPDWKPEMRLPGGRLLEVYPAASLLRWGLSPATWGEDPGSYKGDGADRLGRRGRLMEMVIEECGDRLDFGGDEERFVESDDELDALVCALMARASATGKVEAIPQECQSAALQEGWIQLPPEGQRISAVCA